jgi:lysyl-tRNA synthetase class 1
VDDYLSFLDGFPRQDVKQKLTNPVWHIHAGDPPAPERLPAAEGERAPQVSFALLLNLVAVANAETKDVLWGFLRRYAPGIGPQTHPRLDALVGYAIRYFRDFVKPAKRYRPADADERAALEALSERLGALSEGASAEDIQAAVYDVGRTVPRYHDFKAKTATPERPGVSNALFNALYEILLGEEKGPRFGSFVAIYGIAETRALIEKALSEALIREHQIFLAEHHRSFEPVAVPSSHDEGTALASRS